MADIIDPTIRKFANERSRPGADGVVGYYYRGLAFCNEWDARDLGTMIPNTAAVIVDGSETDGRQQITGANVHQLHGHLAEMVADMEANNNAKLNIALKIAVNWSF